MAKIQVRIREPNATQLHDFPFSVGDEVTIDGDGNTAIVEDAVWEGEDATASAYTVRYTVKTRDGRTRDFELNELFKFNEIP
jgi:hypothetical protein